MGILKAIWSVLSSACVFAAMFFPVQSCAGASVIVAKGIPDSLFSSDASVRNVVDLRRIVEQAPDSSVIVVEGHHWLSPEIYREKSCGNCEEPATEVEATVGLLVTGTAKRLVGVSPEESFVHTNSGYGILFEDCRGCAVESLTITDGARDPDANATDAGVVVKNSSVLVRGNRIVDNIGDPPVVRRTVVGIMGITARENSEVDILGNEILRNSWDAVAFYRDAKGTIEANLIDGLDLARGDEVGGGRGVGIGLTWNAKAAVKGNLVRRYWKGIGVFVDANALIMQNVVEDVATWGISLWDADRGAPFAMIIGNIVFHTGACGIAVIRSPERSGSGGVVVKNVIVMTGQDPKYDDGEPYCYQRALAVHRKPDDFKIGDNCFYTNRESEDKAGSTDMLRDEFLRLSAPVVGELKTSEVLLRANFLKWYDSLKDR
jgi:hypothetical protein